MKKPVLIFLLLVSFFIVISIDETKAQTDFNSFLVNYHPPKFTIGLSVNGNFAAEDAHGASVGSPLSSHDYQMIWGRGLTVYGKLGLGGKQNNRLTLSASYNKMVNTNSDNKVPFFVMAPSDGSVYTDYNLSLIHI